MKPDSLRNETGALRGFGITFDLTAGRIRQWYVGADGIKRWADDDTPCDPMSPTRTRE